MTLLNKWLKIYSKFWTNLKFVWTTGADQVKNIGGAKYQIFLILGVKLIDNGILLQF